MKRCLSFNLLHPFHIIIQTSTSSDLLVLFDMNYFLLLSVCREMAGGEDNQPEENKMRLDNILYNNFRYLFSSLLVNFFSTF